ncbi:MAG: hypothetical protein ACLU4K_01130 [Oscillospiraceae bacterium]
MPKCEKCYHYEMCQSLEDCNKIKKINATSCSFYRDKSLIIELPVPTESYVFVSPNNGKDFHKAIIYGMNKKGSYLVRLCDDLLEENEKHIVKNPMHRIFFDWFFKIYTREEAEKALNAENTV